MTQNEKSGLTAIIVVEGSAPKLASCLNAVKRWIPGLLVMSPEPDEETEQTSKTHGARFIVHPSRDQEELWQLGIRQTESSWYLLIRSNDIVTGQLRKTILEKISAPCEGAELFPLPETTVFLKKRLKYPLAFTDCVSSSLLHLQAPGGHKRLSEIPAQKHPFEGELIHYGSETIGDSIGHALMVAETLADRMFNTTANLSRGHLIRKGFGILFDVFFRKHFLQKRFKEGFEGTVFTFTEGIAKLLGLLRYQEKYIRSGRAMRNRPDSVRRVLLIKLREIGDNVMATPLIRSIHNSFPHAKLTVLTHSYSQPVFENNPYIEHLKGIPASPPQPEIDALIRQLNVESFDLVISTHSGGLATEILGQVHSRHRINNPYIGKNKNYDILVEESDYYRSSIERDLDCIRSIGSAVENPRTELFLNEEEICWAREYLKENGFDLEQKIVVVHPTAAVEIREWDIDRFGKLIQKLGEQDALQTLALCTDSEYSRVQPLYKYVPGLKIFHQITVRQMMAIIHESDLVIDNDSAPSHIATAFNIPSIVLFSHAIREIFRPYDPEKDSHHVLYKDVDCRECKLVECENRICMEFTVDEVLAKSLELTAGSKPCSP